MVDLHCHILPQVDDGPTSLEVSLAMARFYVAEGTTHVFATPHCHRYVHLLRADILPSVSELNKQLEAAKIPLTILPGSEIQVVDTKAYKEEFQAGLYCHYGDDKEFTLLEFNWERNLYPVDAVELISWIVKQGMTPILAHPERHDFFWKVPELLSALVQAGAWIQVTVDSLLGNHGPGPKVSAEKLLQIYPLAVLSTDAHNMSRCSGLSPGIAWVKEHLGQERVDDLLKRADQVLSGAKRSSSETDTPV